jgi:hypothetical protein
VAAFWTPGLDGAIIVELFAVGYTLSMLRAERSSVRTPVTARDCISSKTFRPALDSTQLPVQWKPDLFPGGKAAVDKHKYSYTSTLFVPLMACYRVIFTFTLTYSAYSTEKYELGRVFATFWRETDTNSKNNFRPHTNQEFNFFWNYNYVNIRNLKTYFQVLCHHYDAHRQNLARCFVWMWMVISCFERRANTTNILEINSRANVWN